ncbi:MAG: uroporphyrinogen decarboxylase family protein [Desulfobacterium sp.]|nr:uroporphyrinogen decarboxylase family protein [Desulfobacterium sp.]
MTQLTHRERLNLALNFKETDRTPKDLGGTLSTTMVPDTYRAMKKYLGMTGDAPLGWKRQHLVIPPEQMLQHFDIDTRALLLGRYRGGRAREINANEMIDIWGTLWKRSPEGQFLPFKEVLADAEPTLETLERFEMPDPLNPGYFEGLKERAEYLYTKTDYGIVLDMGIGIFTRSQFMRGFTPALLDMLQNPEFAAQLYRMLTDYWKKTATHALQQVGHLVDVVFWGDDWGMQSSTMMNPIMWRRMIKPLLAEMTSTIREYSRAKVLVHSCGAIVPLIDDLIEIGVNALNPVQVTARDMNPENLAEKFGGKIAFWGGIDTQHLLPFEDPEAVQKAVRHTRKILGPGYVLGSVHNLQAAVPPENIEAMFTA